MTRPAPPDFDRVAGIYRWAEYACFGPLLQRTRTYLLRELPMLHHALIVGDGDGRFTQQFLRAQPGCEVLAIDLSAKMLEKLRARCLRATPNASAHLRTVQQSALDTTPARDTDLIVTHFVLDCFPQAQVDALAQHWGAHLRPGALWLVSDFAIPRAPLLGSLAKIYIRALYAAFRLLTGLRVTRLPDPAAALRSAGFRRLRHQTFLCGLLYTELWRRE
ncbi:MAG TPA: methyltransferase [Acidobacteriaceae bacterium]|jgi:SAM-dependent methyltransferase|nr:methyltransferase [Acidobacteriaceae bacterium]